MLFQWILSLTKEELTEIKKSYSALLKNELLTHSAVELKLNEVIGQWVESEKKATDGKITIII
jgi:hypothetical protein